MHAFSATVAFKKFIFPTFATIFTNDHFNVFVLARDPIFIIESGQVPIMLAKKAKKVFF